AVTRVQRREFRGCTASPRMLFTEALRDDVPRSREVLDSPCGVATRATHIPDTDIHVTCTPAFRAERGLDNRQRPQGSLLRLFHPPQTEQWLHGSCASERHPRVIGPVRRFTEFQSPLQCI